MIRNRIESILEQTKNQKWWWDACKRLEKFLRIQIFFNSFEQHTRTNKQTIIDQKVLKKNRRIFSTLQNDNLNVINSSELTGTHTHMCTLKTDGIK